MRRMRGLLLCLLTLTGPWVHGPAGLVLELRVFNGDVEVSGRTRITVHRAGDREQALAQSTGGPTGVRLEVPEGIYDVQAIEERDGQVVNIQWANRLVVMPYPDEAGRHLEVLNFMQGYGALQVRTRDGSIPDVTLQPAATPDKVPAAAHPGEGYVVFVAPAGTYDLRVRRGTRTTKHAAIEVPRDRTRLWIVPDDER
jgi:hypothetical protein